MELFLRFIEPFSCQTVAPHPPPTGLSSIHREGGKYSGSTHRFLGWRPADDGDLWLQIWDSLVLHEAPSSTAHCANGDPDNFNAGPHTGCMLPLYFLYFLFLVSWFAVERKVPSESKEKTRGEQRNALLHFKLLFRRRHFSEDVMLQARPQLLLLICCWSTRGTPSMNRRSPGILELQSCCGFTSSSSPA